MAMAMENGDTSNAQPAAAPGKKKRNLPGNPDPNAEVIALSPRELMATNRFPCEVCGKGFQRDQNLQLHRRGHNLPWKLKQSSKDGGEAEAMVVRKKVYVCPEVTCVHHDASRALGDLTGIKKHFCRKHGDKKWKCEKCGRKYAVQSDWKAHHRICGTRDYTCDCGTVFSRRDTFVSHRAFCDAFTEENTRGMRQKWSKLQDKNHEGASIGKVPPAGDSDRQVSESAPRLEMEVEVSKPKSWSIISGGAEESSPPSAAKGETCYRCSKGEALSLCLGTGSGTSYYRAWEPPLELEALNRSTSDHETYGSHSSSIFHSPLPSDTSFSSTISAPNNYLDNLSIQQHRHPKLGGGRSCPTLAATTLLQRAVMMGATTNNPYLLRSFGGFGGDPSSIQSAEWKVKDSWAGSTYSNRSGGSEVVCNSADQTQNCPTNNIVGVSSTLRPWVGGSWSWRSWDRVGACESTNNNNNRSNWETDAAEMVEEEEEEDGNEEENDTKKTLDFLGVGPPSPCPNNGAKKKQSDFHHHLLDLNNAIYISSSSLSLLSSVETNDSLGHLNLATSS